MSAPRANETKVTSGNAFVVNLFALEGERKSKYDKITLFSGSLRRLDCLLRLSLGKMHKSVAKIVLVLAIFTKLMKFCTEFQVKQARFLASKCTTFLLHNKPIQKNCLLFSKKNKTQCGL